MGSPTKEKKTVSFGTIQVRNYPIVLGNHPASLFGPSIQLGWDYYYENDNDCTTQQSLDDYERQRRTIPQLFIKVTKRQDMLLAAGFTTDDIQVAMQQKQIVQQQRAASSSSTLWQSWRKQQRAAVRRQRMKRAVHNLRKKKIVPDDIYRGWRLPWSDVLF